MTALFGRGGGVPFSVCIPLIATIFDPIAPAKLRVVI